MTPFRPLSSPPAGTVAVKKNGGISSGAVAIIGAMTDDPTPNRAETLQRGLATDIALSVVTGAAGGAASGVAQVVVKQVLGKPSDPPPAPPPPTPPSE